MLDMIHDELHDELLAHFPTNSIAVIDGGITITIGLRWKIKIGLSEEAFIIIHLIDNNTLICFKRLLYSDPDSITEIIKYINDNLHSFQETFNISYKLTRNLLQYDNDWYLPDKGGCLPDEYGYLISSKHITYSQATPLFLPQHSLGAYNQL